MAGRTHIPDLAGRPICRGTGRTSRLEWPSCPDCQARTTLGGMEPEDAFNPNHPTGRLVLGAGFGIPGFPRIPGLWNRFGKDDE